MNNGNVKVFKDDSVMIQFGKFSQNNNNSDPIEWYVIKSSGTNVKLLCKKIIDVYYFDRFNRTEWSSSDIYRELNESRWFCYLSDAERSTIQDAYTLEKDSYPNISNLSSCHISLLSKEEAIQLPLELRKTTFTNYALSKLGANDVKDVPSDQLKWWTRSVNDESRVSVVNLDGEVLKSRMPSNSILGVRPVIWINLMDAILYQAVNISVTKITHAKETFNDFNVLDLL